MEENMQGESSMDEKAFLLQEIRYSKRKQNVKKFLRYESTGIAAGGTIAMVLEGCAVFVPFYTVDLLCCLYHGTSLHYRINPSSCRTT